MPAAIVASAALSAGFSIGCSGLSFIDFIELVTANEVLNSRARICA